MRHRPRALLAAGLTALLTGLLSFVAASEPAPPALTVEAIYEELTGSTMLRSAWAPEGRRLTWLLRHQDGDVEIWLADLERGEKRLLLGTEELADLAADGDETGRASLAALQYFWGPAGDTILFSLAGRLIAYDLGDKTTKELTPPSGLGESPALSPDGSQIAFVREHDLWVAPLDGGEPRRLTRGGSDVLLHGEVAWVYGEEFGVRTGYHWSPDGRFIAFLESDQQSVPVYPLLDELGDQATVTYQRYPKAGDPNPRVRVGIVEVASGKTAWLDRHAEYVPRVDWADAGALAVQLMNRAQNELQLVLAEPTSGRSRSVLVETDPHWINVSRDLTFLDGGRGFLWSSERSGLRHLYHYDLQGELVRTLTSGEWEVQRIEGVDQTGGWVYFSSNEANPMGRDLHRVSLEGGRRERITAEDGSHLVTLNEQATAFADNHSSMHRAPRVDVRKIDAGAPITIHSAPSVAAYDLVEPEIVELRADDDALVRLMLLKPETLEPDRKYPVLLYVYGGPRSPVIRDSWRQQTVLFHQLLVQRGFVVVAVDDRSSSMLGHKYETVMWHDWGPLAARDHAIAVEHLRSLPFVDPERLAVWGWSGGGYTTCYHMTHDDLFKVGVAVAPVTDWHLYDSIYTERYMGLPEDQPEAYARTSALKAAADLQGKLLLVHGTGDDNVHPQNTIRMLQEAVAAGKRVDLMLYPNKTHGIRGNASRIDLFSRIVAYLEENL